MHQGLSNTHITDPVNIMPLRRWSGASKLEKKHCVTGNLHHKSPLELQQLIFQQLLLFPFVCKHCGGLRLELGGNFGGVAKTVQFELHAEFFQVAP